MCGTCPHTQTPNVICAELCAPAAVNLLLSVSYISVLGFSTQRWRGFLCIGGMNCASILEKIMDDSVCFEVGSQMCASLFVCLALIQYITFGLK